MLTLICTTGLLGLLFVVSVFLCRRWSRRFAPNVRWIVSGLSVGLVTLVLVECLSTSVLHYLFQRKPDLQRLYHVAFGLQEDHIGPAISLNYQPHHYLNYALNPATPYMGTAQYHQQLLIRRTEPLRSRDETPWRGIVLGGSTTFGEQIADEKDTWVYQLEERLRTKWGPECELINGGVGGYTLVENMIHYLTSLSRLAPDVVILYEGINDVHPRLYPDINDDYSGYRKPWRADGQVLPIAYTYGRPLRTYRLLFVLTQLLPLQRGGIHGSVSHAYPARHLWAKRLRQHPPDVYQHHLHQFIQLLQAQGTRVILIPQYFVARAAGDDVFAIGVEEHNQVNATVASQLGADWLGNLFEDPLAKDATFDSCHFTKTGSNEMANRAAAAIMQLRPQVGPANRTATARPTPSGS